MAALDFSDGAMVALYPRDNEARALSIDGGQSPDDLHVTLIYLGTVRDALPLIELVQSVAGGVASKTEALSGTVGGVAQFDDSGQGAPLVLLPDVPGLTELGIALREELARVGVESPSEHGFTPHLTLGYGADPASAGDVVGEPLHFDTLCVVLGSDRFEYELQSPPQALLSGARPNAPLPSEAPMAKGPVAPVRPADTDTEAEIDRLAASVGIETAEPGVLSAPGGIAPSLPLPDVGQPSIAPTNAGQLRWEAVFFPEGVPTDDGRVMDPGAVDWRDLPLSLMAMTETGPGGHQGASIAGRIDRIWREGDYVMGSGIFDDSEFGGEIARMVDERILRGISVDLVVRSFELRPRDETAEQEEPDLVDLLLGGDDSMLYVVTDASIGAVTVCPFPAFADAEIALVAGAPTPTLRSTRQLVMTITKVEAPALDSTSSEGEQRTTVVTASAAGLVPVLPPSEWFENPKLDEPTPMQITDDGRIFGHAALWDTCHIGFEDACVLAPKSRSSYRYFHLGEVEVELQAGEDFDEHLKIPCGQLTLGTGHANLRLNRAQAVDHYDDTGTVAAHVVAGEDEHGIWLAGALHSELEESKVRELRGSKVSGDWRNVAGELELVAMLAVNVPGFPVPRVRVASVGAEPMAEALVAAGVADQRLIDAKRDHEETQDLAATAIGTEELVERARSDEPAEPNSLAASALESLTAAHAQTVDAISRLFGGEGRDDTNDARNFELARASIEALGKVASRELPRAPDVHVHVPEQNLSVDVKSPDVHVDVETPTGPAPQIDVHVPAQPAPEVIVAAPEVRLEIPAAQPRSVRVIDNDDGTRSYVQEEVEAE